MMEKIRGCGYRKVGGLYLVSDEGVWLSCDRLPLNLTVCPCCGEGIKQTKGFRWVDPVKLFNGDHFVASAMQTDKCVVHLEPCKDTIACPFCHPSVMGGNAGLLWVGEKFYKTPQDFNLEAESMGISKRINAIPKDFVVGKTWIILAHREAGFKKVPLDQKEIENMKRLGVSSYLDERIVRVPAIFTGFVPKRIELLIWKSEATVEKIQELEKRGITPVIVPDGDADHDPKRRITSDVRLNKQKLKEAEEAKQKKLDVGSA